MPPPPGPSSPGPPSSTMSTQLAGLRVTPACPPLPGSPHLYIGTSNGIWNLTWPKRPVRLPAPTRLTFRGFSSSACGPFLHQVPEAEESQTPPCLLFLQPPTPSWPWSSPVRPPPKQIPALPTSCQGQCPLRVTAGPLPGCQLHACCHPSLHKGGKTESPSCLSISPPWSLVPGTSRACLPPWPSDPPTPGSLCRATPAACFFASTAPSLPRQVWAAACAGPQILWVGLLITQPRHTCSPSPKPPVRWPARRPPPTGTIFLHLPSPTTQD